LKLAFHFFRLRATAIPTKPNPISANVPGSATVAVRTLGLDGFQSLQLPGIWVHSGGSANKAVDITKRNTDIIVFISLPNNIHDEVAWRHALTCISTKS